MSDVPPAPPPQPKSRSWLLFVAGFLVVFVGILALPMNFYDGDALYRTTLWHYYTLEIQHALGRTTHTLTIKDLPSSSGPTAVLVSHVMISLAGGVLFWGIHKVVRKLLPKR